MTDQYQKIQDEIDACDNLAKALQEIKVSKAKKRCCFDSNGKPCDLIGEAIVKAGLKSRLGKVFGMKQPLFGGKKGPVYLEAADTVKKVIPSLSPKAEVFLCDIQIALDGKRPWKHRQKEIKLMISMLTKALNEHSVHLDSARLLKSLAERIPQP